METISPSKNAEKKYTKHFIQGPRRAVTAKLQEAAKPIETAVKVAEAMGVSARSVYEYGQVINAPSLQGVFLWVLRLRGGEQARV